MTRLLKIASLLKKEISTILRVRVNNSNIGFISITDVEVSRDLSTAKVYYSQLGSDKEIQKTKKALASSIKFIHFELCKVIKHLQNVPKLKFIYDDGIARGVEIINKLNEIHHE